MKKLTISFLFILAAVSVKAQNKIEIGLVAGGGYFNTITSENEFKLTNSFSVNGGLYVLKPVFNRQFVESGLRYNFRKTAIDEMFLQVDMDLNSLELPINYGWKLNNNIVVKAGLSGAWLLTKNIEREKFEMNAQLGAGYDLNWVKIFLNYQQGINKSDFMYKRDNRGLFIKYRRSVIMFDVNIPIFR